MNAILSQSNLAPEMAQEALSSLIRQGRVVEAGQGPNRLLFEYAGWKQLEDNILAAILDYHRKYPLRLGMPKAEISQKVKLGGRSLEVLQKLVSDGLLVEELTAVHLPGRQIQLSSSQQAKMDAYLRQLDQNPYSPAPETELEPDLLNLLIDRGLVVKTVSGVIFSAQAYNEMTEKVLSYLHQHGRITVAEVRDMFGSSRRYVLALLEHLDEKKITKRVGDERVAGPAAPTS